MLVLELVFSATPHYRCCQCSLASSPIFDVFLKWCTSSRNETFLQAGWFTSNGWHTAQARSKEADRCSLPSLFLLPSFTLAQHTTRIIFPYLQKKKKEQYRLNRPMPCFHHASPNLQQLNCTAFL